MTEIINTPESTTPKPAQPRVITPGRIMSTSATFILLILTLFASLAALYAISLTQETNQVISSLQKTIKDTHTHTRELEMALATVNEAHAGIQSELSNFIHQINPVTVSEDQLRLAVKQALEYLELAQIESRLESNESVRLLLLTNAKSSLQATKDASLQPVLAAIDEAQQNINHHPKINLTQLLSQFHELEDQLSALSPSIALPPQTTSTPAASNQTEFDKTLNTFKHLIVIKRHVQTNASRVSLQAATSIDRILLNLQIAKLALLQHNASLYELSLKQAHQDLSSAFDNQPELKQTFLNSLNELSKIKINTSLPDIEKPLTLLKQWMDTHKAPQIINSAKPS